MSEFDLKIYFFRKWREAEILEEKFSVLIDFLYATDCRFTEHFDIDLDNVECMDKYDIEDYMLENVIELDNLWIALIKYDSENEEED